MAGPSSLRAVVLFIVYTGSVILLYGLPSVSSLRPNSISSRDKVERLGSLLKRRVTQLRQAPSGQVELVFLVDASGSVGSTNFRDELNFVRKLLADFTVDMNNTRVALVTFSSRTRVVREVDQITAGGRDQHKCSLLQDQLPDVQYRGGGTYTLGAMMEARAVLQYARPQALRSVFLVTDGFSNGGNPRPLAADMRAKGIEIFTIGIKNGNPVELREMASKPKEEHCFILDSFAEFEALARRALHEDLQTGTYVTQTLDFCSSLCDGHQPCCDVRASCACGTHTGKYECLCPPGTYGDGFKCIDCPEGTHKKSSGSGDVTICWPCPDQNHVTPKGSVSVADCTCSRGYQDDGHGTCTAMTCPELTPPDNGYFVQKSCGHVVNAACGIRCNPGYRIEGSSIRICQEDGSWRGTTATCQVKKCPALTAPENGHMTCSQDDFAFQTTCKFSCDDGYKLFGSTSRTCLAIAFWNGIQARCRALECKPLLPLADGRISPTSCTERPMPFKSICRMACREGFKLVGVATRDCLSTGRWNIQGQTQTKCVDIQPPSITCPADITIDAEHESDEARVTWSLPITADNSGQLPATSVIPALIPPVNLPIGSTSITYIAEDTYRNKAKCTFTVHVKDTQPPQVDSCVSPPPFTLRLRDDKISWNLPIFSDNARVPPTVTSSHKMTDRFPLGTTAVMYKAYDAAGNNVTCSIDITVQEHACANPPVPHHGNVTCEAGHTGVQCTLTCQQGFGFAIGPPDIYTCEYDVGVWGPAENMPFPDCSVSWMSNEVSQGSRAVLHGPAACDDRHRLNMIETTFYTVVSNKIDRFCGGRIACAVDQMSTECLDSETEYDDREMLTNEIANTLNLGKRKRRTVDVWGSEEESIGITFKVTGSTEEDLSDMDRLTQTELKEKVKEMIRKLQLVAHTGQLDIQIGEHDVTYSTESLVGTEPQFTCTAGSVLKGSDCVKCPVGTFYNVVGLKCEPCGQGTYQPLEGKLTCLVCPGNTSTAMNYSKSEQDCRGQCLPGTFSTNGLERCETCAIGMYQSEYAQTQCLHCPGDTSTWRRGTRRAEECGVLCQAGYVSKTGLEPCFPCPAGYYQSARGQVSCLACPVAATDMNSTGATDRSSCPVGLDSLSNTPAPENLVMNDCFAEPCENQATCHSLPVGYVCMCPPGWTGPHCEFEIDECYSSPCLNNGTCEDSLAHFTCICQPGFTGHRCNEEVNECDFEHCLHGSTCMDLLNGFLCLCNPGYNGTHCEDNVDECAEEPCQNEAECIDVINGYECACAEGFDGQLCEIDLDECESAPCQNGASCSDGPNMFSCACAPGYTGHMCEMAVDECASQPCYNSAICVDGLAEYTCKCAPGYTGINCETELESDLYLEYLAASLTDYASCQRMYENLTEVTISVWLKTNDTDNYGTVLSYATADDANALTIMDYSGFVLYVNGVRVVTDVTSNDGRWHHIAVTWTSHRGYWVIYKDGQREQEGEGLAVGSAIPGGGTVILGQEQDRLGGDFNIAESFIGRMYALNVWSEVLLPDDIVNLYTTCESYRGSTLSWADLLADIRGNVVRSETRFCEACAQPQPISNGNVTWNSLVANIGKATYVCDTGYRLEGAEIRTCQISTDWSADEPLCTLVVCGFPGSIRHGSVVGFRYTYGQEITYSCDTGFMLQGNSSRRCEASGYWSGDSPRCLEPMCTRPSVEAALRLSPEKKLYRPGDELRFKCALGFELVGQGAVQCQTDGLFSSSVPQCVERHCQDPPSIEHGAAVLEARRTFTLGTYLTYECDQGYVVQGHSAIKCLISGQWEMPPPLCRLIYCAPPQPIQHGSVEITQADQSTIYAYGTVVRYNCSVGHMMVGESSISCDEHGLWNSSSPVCQTILCAAPPVLENGWMEVKSYTYNSTVTYFCNVGFRLRASERRVCTAAGTWEGSDPICERVSCGPPEEIEHGDVTGDSFQHGDSARYSCHVGYELVGRNELRCFRDGNWESPTPYCRTIQCPVPRRLEHGTVHTNAYGFKAVVEYVCNPGFLLRGSSLRTCMSNAKWNGTTPVCQRVTCGEPMPIIHGHVMSILTQYVPGSVVHYGCDIGYELRGKTSRTCRIDGTWTGPTPKCDMIQCNALSNISNGFVSTEGVTYGSVATYVCEEGYYLDGPVGRMCSSAKQWDGPEPQCSPVPCPDLMPIDHGQFDADNFYAHATAIYKCEPGYILEGPSEIRCQANGTWDQEPPLCVPVICTQPSFVIANGRMVSTNFTYGSTIHYICDLGYEISGSDTRFCTITGQWEGTIPSCEAVQCPRLDLPQNGYVDGIDRRYSSEVAYSCVLGYQLIGVPKRRCRADRTWSSEAPYCIPIECERPDPIPHGVVTYQGRLFNDTAQYTCHIGYRLRGHDTRQCGLNQQWQGEIPQCEVILCTEPPTIPNGHAMSDTLEYLDTVIYQCHAGYVLESSETLMCDSSGEFIGNLPQCIPIECPMPEIIPHGTVTKDGQSFTDTMHYSCLPGYNLRGLSQLTCLSNSSWSGQPPRCVPVECVNPTIPAHGNVSAPGGLTYTSAITYTCHAGYELVGPVKRQCLSSGLWSDDLPECKRITCTAPNIHNGVISSLVHENNVITDISGDEEFLLTDLVNLRCNDGYAMNGEGTLECLHNRSWSGLVPVCIPVQCPTVNISNALPSHTETVFYPESLVIDCLEGYTRVGSSQITCGGDGTWQPSLPECNIQACPDVNISHGSLHLVGNPSKQSRFLYGDIAKVVCQIGYEFKGTNAVTCLASGIWSHDIGHCLPTVCHINNVHNQLLIEPLETKYAFGTSVTFSCVGHYALEGNATVQCGLDHQWSTALPTCKQIVCPLPDLPHGLVHGTFSANPSEFPVGMQIYFKCQPGRRLVGQSTALCREDSTWSSTIPICELVTCRLPTVAGAQRAILTSHISSDQPVYGTNLTIVCDEGYIPSHNIDLQCGPSGEWIGDVPVCTVVTCQVPNVANGQVSLEEGLSALNFGDVLHTMCLDGYKLSHQSPVHCLANGSLSQDIPSCEPVLCDAPEVAHGSIHQIGADERSLQIYTYPSTIELRCGEGYTVSGSQIAKCSYNGTWVPLLGNCEPVRCPPLNIQHGSLSTNDISFNTTVTFSCLPGYILEGQVKSTCKTNGQWDEPPQCVDVECAVPVVMNGIAIPLDGEERNTAYRFEETAQFLCREGYELLGAQQSMCQLDSEWIPPIPTCEMVACPFPDLDHAVYQHPENEVMYGGRLQVSCEHGYMLQGSGLIQCTAGGTWTPDDDMPSCILMFCDTPYIANGYFEGGHLYDQYSAGEYVSFECEHGFVLVGQDRLQCLENGSWSDSTPACKPITCEKPEVSHSSRLDVGSGDDGQFVVGDFINVQCDIGYDLVGEAEIYCDAHGDWSSSLPQCHISKCIEPTIENGHVIGESFVYGQGIQYVCDTGYELVGPAIVHCQADGFWAFRSYCRPFTCRLPQSIPHGSYSGKGFKFGDVIEYSCHPGYHLVGESVYQCRSDKTWGNTIPACHPNACPGLHPQENGYITKDGIRILPGMEAPFYFGDKARYECNVGYRLNGQATIGCLVDGNWGAAPPTCDLIACGVPEGKPNTRIIGTSYSFKDTVEYTCEEGYEMEDQAIFKCTRHGMWRGDEFKCSLITCPMPEPIDDGDIQLNDVTLGSSVEYRCDTGYVLVGESTRQCQSNRQWSGIAPICVIVTCPEPPPLPHGSLIGGEHTYLSTLDYSCDIGFEPTTPDSRSCQENGQWSGTDSVCTRITCPVPEPVDHGRYEGRDYSYAASLQYSCDVGYQLTGPSQRICQADHQWSGPIPVCELKECPQPVIPENSIVHWRGDMMVDGSSVTIECKTGYRISGDSELTCYHGESWTGEFPACDKISCGVPQAIEHGKMNGDAYEYNDTVAVKCVRGYRVVGDPNIHCQGNGQWSPIHAKCVLLHCGEPPFVINATFKGGGNKYGDFVFYRCGDGFEMNGNNLLQCGEEGKWLGSLPSCAPVTCGPVPTINHATITVTKTTYGSKATYRCNRGYILHGSATIACMENGTWMYTSPPQCVPRDCGRPPLLKHGDVTYADTTLHNIATYRCSERFRISAQVVLQCGAMGYWNGSAPTCHPITCPLPPRPMHGGYIDGNDYVVGSILTYHCDMGYVLQGRHQRRCTENGTWDDLPPLCLESHCDPLLEPANGRYNTTGTLAKTVVELLCHSGFRLVGNSIAVCMENGSWSVAMGICEEEVGPPCSSPPLVANGAPSKMKFHVGHVYHVLCQTGYQSIGDMTVTCLPDHTWTLPLGYCSRTYCGPPVVGSDIMVMGRSYYYNDRLVYRCRAGFAAATAPYLTCQADGTWDITPKCTATCKFPCQHGGVCMGLNKCRCPPGYSGRFCEHVSCILPCLHGGKCVSPYQCQCQAGYTGTRCQTPVCGRRCSNGGYCALPNRCHCPPGYKPPFCTELVSASGSR